MLVRKFVYIRVAGEGAQPVRSLRFENVYAHGVTHLKLPHAARSKSRQSQLIPALRQCDSGDAANRRAQTFLEADKGLAPDGQAWAGNRLPENPWPGL